MSGSVAELDQEKLSPLLQIKYYTIHAAQEELGRAQEIGVLFAGFQKYLYQPQNAA